MTELTRQIQIDASPSEVYKVVSDPSCLQRWVTIQDCLEEGPSGDLEQGARVVQRLRVAGRCFHVRWTVSDAQPPSLLVWDGRGPLGSRAHAVYKLSENGRGTIFSYTNEYSLPGGPAGRALGRALASVSKREADRSLRRLKDLIERDRH